MKNRFFLIYALFLIGVTVTAQNSNELLENRVRVKFYKKFDTNTPQFDSRSGKGFLVLGDRQVDALNDEFQASGMQRVFPFAGKFEEKHKKYGLHLWYDITVQENENIEEVVRQYGELDIVSTAEPIRVYNSGGLSRKTMSTNDPRLTEQWHYENAGQTGGVVGADISLFDAWEVESGDPRVVVSVHDSGIDTNHPDLVNRLWTNDEEIPNDGIDNDNNGFVDDYHGYNFAAAVRGGDPSSVYDYNGHGTHTSGTIAAENNNGIGVAGVAGGTSLDDGVRIMMMRLGDDYGSNSIYNPAPSFVYAADMGAVISSNSWGGGGYDQSLIDAINYFIVEGGSSSPALEGGLVIMSSGNSSSSYPDYRSDLDGVMMVSATNHNDQKAWYSNYGQWVDISAPGGETSITNQGVLSTLPNGYGFFQGTSMACPHVSGGAALLASKAYGSGLTRQELFDALIQGSNSIDDVNPSFVGLMGSGRLNVAQSLDLVAFGSGGAGGELVIDPGKISTEMQEGTSEIYTVRLSNTSSFDLEVDIEASGNPSWLDIEVVNLSILANSTAKFEVTLNASSGGDLTESDLIFSYIGLNSLEELSIPITIYTLGEPELAAPDTLFFDSNYLGLTTSNELTIGNSGTDYLEIVRAFNSNQDYQIEFDSTVLAPDKDVTLQVFFTPSTGGDVIDSLYFISNDPVNDSTLVILTGVGNANVPPTLTVDQSEIFVQIANSDRYGNQTLTISNTGEEELTFTIEANPNKVLDLSEFEQVSGRDPLRQGSTGPENNYLGDFSSALKSPVDIESGLAWDGEFLWIRDAESDQIYRFDTENGIVTDSISSLAANGVSLAYDGEYLWEHDKQERLIKYNLNGDSVSQVLLQQGRGYADGITIDQESMWMSHGYIFVQIDLTDGSDIRSFQSNSAYQQEGLVIINNRLFSINQGSVSETVIGNNYPIRSTSYIAGRYREQTANLAYDGAFAWASFNSYGLLVRFDLFPNFLDTPYPSSYSLQPGESVQSTPYYNLSTYNFDAGTSYTDELRLTSNDPQNGSLTIPFHVDIEGAPQLSTAPNHIFIENYLGYRSTDTLLILNNGNEALEISSVSSSDPNFEFEFSATDVQPNGVYELLISMELMAPDTLTSTLTIASNDPVNPLVLLEMEAISYFPPNVSVAEESLDISLYQAEVDSLMITVTNSGDGALRYQISNNYGLSQTGANVVERSTVFSGNTVLQSKEEETNLAGIMYASEPSAESDLIASETISTLENVLDGLDQGHQSITSLIPNRYNFSEGESGSQINDGGFDMYDGGNRLGTNFGSSFQYSNGMISTNHHLLDGGDYFTAKYEGLFVFSADLNNVTSFNINGGLGADGGGSADGSVLSIVRGGVEFFGFVKRVYDTSYEPSVNHLVIVRKQQSISHTFDTYTNNDTHSVNGLEETDRLYYLLFAGANGQYIDDPRMLEIMKEFLSIAGEGGETVSVMPGETIENYVIFDVSALDTGEYDYNVEIIHNDPEKSAIEIPTTVLINSSPVIELDQDSVIFNQEYVGGLSQASLYVNNNGRDTLIVSDAEVDSEYFEFKLYQDTIPPGQFSYGLVSFLPKDTINYSASLRISSNDPVRALIEVPLKGEGITSTILSTSTYRIKDSVNIGATKTYPFTVKSVGTDSLDYRIVIQERVSYSQLINRIEEIKAQSKSSSSTSASELPMADYSISMTGNNRILLLGADVINNINNVYSQLYFSGQFSYIGYVDVSNYSNISVDDLEPYDAVIVWKSEHGTFGNAIGLGNALADYVDAGGGVVTAMFENVSSSLGGRWSGENGKYSLFKAKNEGYGPVNYPSINKILLDHELLVDVDNLNGSYNTYLSNLSADDVVNDAEIVATWSNGSPLIVAKELQNSRRVDLGLSPLSRDYLYGSWTSSTDGNQILVNALNYVASKTDGRSELDWISVSDYEVKNLIAGDSIVSEFVVDTEKLEEGWTGARAYFYSNDSRYYNQAPSILMDFYAIGEANVSIPDSVIFDDLSVGFSGSKNLVVLNEGDGSTELFVQLDSASQFSIEQSDTVVIQPFERKSLIFSFESTVVGTFSETAIVHDVLSGSSQEVMLVANVAPIGVIRLEPATVELVVEYEGQVESEFIIHNDGEGELAFFLEAFHLPGQLANIEQNNAEKIHFDRFLEKGELDFRKGHAVMQGMGSDSFGYMYIDSHQEDGPLFNWNDISESGIEITFDDDDANMVELPFEFSFYGLRNSRIYLGSNGVIGMELAGVTSPINRQIPNESAPNGIIAPFWTDLVSGENGRMYYQISQESITIQYEQMEDYDQTGTFTFQVVIYKSGDILIQYEEMDGNTSKATVGLENQFGTQGLQIAFNTNYITDNQAIYISHPVGQISPEITSGHIAPGDSLPISFTYSALSDLGGLHEKEIAILSNDTSSVVSLVEILAFVEGTSKVLPTADSLYFDSTYISRVSRQTLYFENDSTGVLSITDLASSNEDFVALLPFFTAKLESDEGPRYRVSINSNSGRIEGIIENINSQPTSIRIFRNRDGLKERVLELNAIEGEDGYGIYDVVWSLAERTNLWQLANEEWYFDIFTLEDPEGIGARPFTPEEYLVDPLELSHVFTTLYRPSSASADTTLFTLQSNAINGEDVRIPGFGVGLMSEVTIDVSTAALEESLSAGDSVKQVFTVTNEGTDSLTFSLKLKDYRFESNLNPIGFDEKQEKTLEKVDLSREVSSVMDEFPFFGFFHDSNFSYMVSSDLTNPGSLRSLVSMTHGNVVSATEFFPGSEEIVINIDVVGNFTAVDLEDRTLEWLAQLNGDDTWTGMTTDIPNNRFYACTYASLYEVDLQTNTAIRIGRFDHYGMLGIAINMDGEMYGYTDIDEFVTINPENGNTSYVGPIGFNAGFQQDLAYNQSTDEFYMAAFNLDNYDAELRLVDEETGSTSLVGRIAQYSGFAQLSSLAFPTETTSFLSYDLADTTLAAGQAVDVTASFNARGLKNGTHSTNLEIHSNDLSNPTLKIPVNLAVLGNEPKVSQHTKEINFGLLTVMDTASNVIRVQNLGGEVLVISLANQPENFTLETKMGDSIRVDINEMVDIPVQFVPTEARTFEHDLLWNTNDPELPKMTISLSGAGERASKELEMELDVSDFELPRNAEGMMILKLRSVGRDSVRYTLAPVEELAWFTASSDTSYISAGDSIEYIVNINSTDVEIGFYSTDLLLTSDDPLYDSLRISLTLSVYNNPPSIVQPLGNALLAIGNEADSMEYILSNYFEDADEDIITYTMNVRNSGANFVLESDTLNVFGLIFGADTLDITAHDGIDSVNAIAAIFVNVPPGVSRALPDFHTRVGDPLTEVIDLDHFFVDSGGNGLEYSISALSTTFADLNVTSENVLIIKGLSVSSEVVTITAFDGYHSVEQTFMLVVDDALNVEDIQNSIILYPNPVQSVLNFEFQTAIAEEIKILLVDITGKVLMSVEPESAAGAISESFDVSELASGIYVMEVIVEDKTIFVTRVSKE